MRCESTKRPVCAARARPGTGPRLTAATGTGTRAPVDASRDIVIPKEFEFGSDDDVLVLESGRPFGPITVRYETYGTLDKAASNAVLLLHAFSGDAHAAGYLSGEESRPGWWDSMVGPGKPFDTDRYFVICSNVLGGCRGTTGPGSIDPASGAPYGLSFPVVTIGDMVNVQERLVTRLGIKRLLAVAGGSMGGMQALQWTVSYPARVASAIILATTARPSAQAIAFNAVGRNAIMSDPRWRGGAYYGHEPPARGLAIARMVGHITYLSDASMHAKFGRRLQERDEFGFDFSDQFEVESYLEYKGGTFVDRFDANSYIYLSKAIDYFDLEGKYGSLERAFANAVSKFLVVSYTSDWLYPSYQSKEIVVALMRQEKDVSYTEIDSPFGHDSFLIETERQGRMISSFLQTAQRGEEER
ncbi:MAG: homoserine O-acetyltransferase [Spirochaetaceae bacterium]|nr:MAG: homoserine O-acetyltransferase [Spirochaetaceae bacterium]